MPASSCSRLRVCSEAGGSAYASRVAQGRWPGDGQVPGGSRNSDSPASFGEVATRVAALYEGLLASTEVKSSSLGSSSSHSANCLVRRRGECSLPFPSALPLDSGFSQASQGPSGSALGQVHLRQQENVKGSAGGSGSAATGSSKGVRWSSEQPGGVSKAAGQRVQERVAAVRAPALVHNLVHLVERWRKSQFLHSQQQRGSPAVGGQGDSCSGRVSGSFLGTPSISDFFKLQHELGRGHLGLVRLCRCRVTDKLYACKTVPKASITKLRHVEEVTTEILALAELQLTGEGLTRGARTGPFMLRLHELFDDSDAIHLILDYCEVGDLLSYVLTCGRLPEAQCAAMLLQLVTALGDMHNAGLVHRDIKPENILLTRGTAGCRGGRCRSVSLRMTHRDREAGQPDCDLQFRLADLGSCARLSSGETLAGFAGSPKYMAPEIVEGLQYGKEVDIWSLGVVLYACLAGKQPFVGETLEDVFDSIRCATPDLYSSPWCSLSEDARGLVSSMLCKDPSKRISLSGILRHPWMLMHCFQPVVEENAVRSHSPPSSITIWG